MLNNGRYYPTIVDVQLECQARISPRPDKLLGDGTTFERRIKGSESGVFVWYHMVGTWFLRLYLIAMIADSLQKCRLPKLMIILSFPT